MELLACGHAAYPGPGRSCPHLIAVEARPRHIRRFTGQGVQVDFTCPDCADAHAVTLEVVCEGCVASLAADDWACAGYRGEPEVRRRPEPHSPVVRTHILPWAPLDLAPVADHPHEWLLLGVDGVARWRSDTGELVGTTAMTLPAIVGEPYWDTVQSAYRVYASPDGRFAAVVVDFDRYGTVVDLDTGLATLALDRGDYLPGTTQFPVAFARLGGAIRVIHATAWNRLDLSDPATGELLTGRDLSEHDGDQRPEHYLDYFHGRLHVSADGAWIADDGWVWQPLSVPTVWSLTAWLDNPYESEDGETRADLTVESDWNRPMCWVGSLLALNGLSDDVGEQLAAVRLFDPARGPARTAFAGPTGRLFGAPDGSRLFSANEHGLAIWDAATGEHTGSVPGLNATAYHPASGEFVAFEAATVTVATPLAVVNPG